MRRLAQDYNITCNYIFYYRIFSLGKRLCAYKDFHKYVCLLNETERIKEGESYWGGKERERQ